MMFSCKAILLSRVMVVSIFVFESARATGRRASRSIRMPQSLRPEPTSIVESDFVPTDGTRLPIISSGDFGRSPSFRQLSAKPFVRPREKRYADFIPVSVVTNVAFGRRPAQSAERLVVAGVQKPTQQPTYARQQTAALPNQAKPPRNSNRAAFTSAGRSCCTQWPAPSIIRTSRRGRPPLGSWEKFSPLPPGSPRRDSVRRCA
jgi:hypothetical protein